MAIVKMISIFLIIMGVYLFLFPGEAETFVIREDGKSYIVDRTGARWDVTQAESIGFRPEGFQYGLGKDAFTPLDDREIDATPNGVSSNLRVIGITEGEDARAYSVPRLRRHEVANSHINDTPIAAAY